MASKEDQSKKVSDSFNFTKSLSDTDLSENYDEDPFYQDVPDVAGVLLADEEEEKHEESPEDEETSALREAARQEFAKLRENGLQSSVAFDFNMKDVSFA